MAHLNTKTPYPTSEIHKHEKIIYGLRPSSGGGKGKKGGGDSGGGVQFSIPYAGPGIYKLTVANITKDGYTFDPCHGVLRQSVYL